jgi:hypothetical protein
MDAGEKEKTVERLSPTLQVCFDEGLVAGHLQSLEVVLDLLFGEQGLALMPRLRQITEPDVLERLLRASKTAPDLEAFRNMLPPQPQA